MGVSASGLVYAAIVLMWAAVLIPMWVRRHDASTEGRSAERFGQAMQVLSRREASGDRREIVVPGRPASATAPMASGSGAGRRPVVSHPVSASPASSPSGRSSRAAARAQLARRRARTLLVLGSVAVLLGLMAVFGVVPVWAPLAVALLLTGFVVHLRVQAKRTAERRRHRPVPRPVEQPAASRRTAASVDDRAATSRALVVETKGEARTTTVDGSKDLAPAALQDDEAAAHADDPRWRPNPMPLPTYVTAPKAVRPIRVIDLTTPGAWTSGRLLEDDVPVAEDALAEAVADAQELDALLEREAGDGDPGSRRRAVGD